MSETARAKPWDTPGLPPREQGDRCQHHKHCAYRDDDPARCSLCHATPKKCSCNKVWPDDI
jgi:hypothetical protein